MSQLFRETLEHNSRTQASFPALLCTRLPKTRHCHQFIFSDIFTTLTIVIIVIKIRTRKTDHIYVYIYGANCRNKIKNANLSRFAIYIFMHLEISLL